MRLLDVLPSWWTAVGGKAGQICRLLGSYLCGLCTEVLSYTIKSDSFTALAPCQPDHNVEFIIKQIQTQYWNKVKRVSCTESQPNKYAMQEGLRQMNHLLSRPSRPNASSRGSLEHFLSLFW